MGLRAWSSLPAHGGAERGGVRKSAAMRPQKSRLELRISWMSFEGGGVEAGAGAEGGEAVAQSSGVAGQTADGHSLRGRLGAER